MKIGQGKALKNKWIKKDGAGFIRAVSALFDSSGSSRGGDSYITRVTAWIERGKKKDGN
jgi:hypothetical protein